MKKRSLPRRDSFGRRFLETLLIPAFRPLSGIDRLLRDPDSLTLSVLVFLFLGGIYTLSVQLAYARGLGAQVEPLLAISAADYYRYQRFFQIPFFFITSVIFAGTVRLLSIPARGRGRFEDHFCLFCAVQTLPMFLTMWLPETFLFFPGTPIRPVWLDVVRQLAGILWPLALMTLGVRRIEGVRAWAAGVIVLAAALPITVLMVIFIR